MIFTDKLYESIIKNNASDANELNVISGYASSTFLMKVNEEFPHLKINLYIGMSNEGISQSNHLNFTEMTMSDNINIYYQIKGNPNHMKVYEFHKESGIYSFIGSANFSENGFFNNQEILCEVNEIPKYVFDNQKQISLLCNDEEISKFVDIKKNFIYKEFTSEVLVTNETDLVLQNDVNTVREQRFKLLVNSLYSRVNQDFYKKFNFLVVLPEQNDVSWSYKGINHEKPYLKQNNNIKFNDVFPNDKVFTIHSKDFTFEACVKGRFNSHLYFLNVNIYEYFKSKIGLKENRALSYQDLDSHNLSQLYFERINETEYILQFEE